MTFFVVEDTHDKLPTKPAEIRKKVTPRITENKEIIQLLNKILDKLTFIETNITFSSPTITKTKRPTPPKIDPKDNIKRELIQELKQVLAKRNKLT